MVTIFILQIVGDKMRPLVSNVSMVTCYFGRSIPVTKVSMVTSFAPAMSTCAPGKQSKHGHSLFLPATFQIVTICDDFIK